MQVFYVLRKATRRARRILGGNIRFRVVLLGSLLLFLFALHTAAMMLFEDLSIGDAAWLTITTATTVGYGDMSAATAAGRWSTVVLMYIGGIFILAQLAGLVFEGVQSKLEKQRLGQVNLNVADHVVIFGYREKYLHRVIQEIRNSSSDLREEEVVIVSPNLQELPEDFVRQAVFHVSGALYDDEVLDRANVSRAKRVAIMPESDEYDNLSPTNLELITRLQERAPDVPIVFAANHRNEKAMAEELGAEDAITFDPNYPDIFARAIISLGAEDILTDIVDRDGVEIIIVHKRLSATVKEVMEATGEWATLLGVRMGVGDYKINPPKDLALKDHRLVFLADIDTYGSDEAAQEAIVKALQPYIRDGEELREFVEPNSIGVIGSDERVSDSFLKQLKTELEDQTVTHFAKSLIDSEKGNSEEVGNYDAIVLLAADPTDPYTDAATYLNIRRLRQTMNYEGRIIAEAVLPQSKERLNKAGANDILRPVVQNVEILGRCITTGAEEIFDDLYSSFGLSELLAFEVDIAGSWREFTDSVSEVGLPIAFANAQGKHVAPAHDFMPGRGRVYIVIDKNNPIRYKDIYAALPTG